MLVKREHDGKPVAITTVPSLSPTDYEIIPLTHGKYALCSPEDYAELSKHCWHARKSYSRYYAMRRYYSHGSEHWVRMHREVMNTPRWMITHHKNRRTLDNRRENLQNMLQRDHRNLHLNNDFELRT